MTTSATKRLIAAGAVVLLVGVGACGGGTSKDKASTGSSSSTSTSTAASSTTTKAGTTATTKAGATATTAKPDASTDPRTKAQLAADTAIAKHANLVAADMPAGWTVSSDDDSSSSDDSNDTSDTPEDKALAACLGVDPGFLQGSTVDESSDEFDKDDASASSEVAVEANDTVSKQEFAVIAGPRFLPCFETFATAAFKTGAADPSNDAQGMTVGKVTATSYAFPSLGDQSLAVRVSAPFTYQGQTFTMDLDTVFARTGRGLVTMDFTNVNGPNDQAVEQATSRAVVTRLDAAT